MLNTLTHSEDQVTGEDVRSDFPMFHGQQLLKATTSLPICFYVIVYISLVQDTSYLLIS